jgi:hypothetical protein
MTFLAIYLFVFPHYLKPNEEDQVKQKHILKMLNRKISHQEGHIEGLYILKLKANKEVKKIFKKAIYDLEKQRSFKDMQIVYETAKRNLGFSSMTHYVYKQPRKFHILKPPLIHSDNLEIYKKLLRLELLKQETLYLEKSLGSPWCKLRS